jgi:hypothetical protein
MKAGAWRASPGLAHQMASTHGWYGVLSAEKGLAGTGFEAEVRDGLVAEALANVGDQGSQGCGDVIGVGAAVGVEVSPGVVGGEPG